MLNKMDIDPRKGKVKLIVYLLAFVLIYNIIIFVSLYINWSYLIATLNISLIIYAIGSLALILIPFAIIGLLLFKKWGLILSYIISIIYIVSPIINIALLFSASLITTIIWVIVFYYLYKYRNVFT